MKIIVPVKRVVSSNVKIRVKTDATGIITDNVQMEMNPFDEIAMEEAIRLQEQGLADEIIAVTIGQDIEQDSLILRHALALGASRAILIHSFCDYCSLNIAKILQKVVQDEKPNLVLMGKQSIDTDNNQTPQMLSALLKWPQATFVSKIIVCQQEITVHREVDEGLEVLAMQLPMVISVDLRLNSPRYATLPNIMKARQKPMEIIPVDKLGLTLKEHRRIVSVTSPRLRTKGIFVASVNELLDKLHVTAPGII